MSSPEDPDQPSTSLPPTPPEDAPLGADRRWWYVAAALGAILVVLVALLVTQGDDDEAVTADDTTSSSVSTTSVSTTTAVPTTTTAPATTTTAASTTTATSVPTGQPDRSQVIYPPAGSETFRDPVALTERFATDFLRFADPVVGSFQASGSGSGEVPIRPVADGPVTTVALVQPAGSEDWYVVGASTDHIDPTAPAPHATVTSPIPLEGTAWAFEGTVVVELRVDGVNDAVTRTFVTGGGDEMRPYTGSVTFDPGPKRNAVILYFTDSAENGQVWEAATVQVVLAG